MQLHTVCLQDSMYFGIKGLSTSHLCLVAEKVNLKILLLGQALLAKSAICSGRKKKLLVLRKNKGQSELEGQIFLRKNKGQTQLKTGTVWSSTV